MLCQLCSWAINFYRASFDPAAQIAGTTLQWTSILSMGHSHFKLQKPELSAQWSYEAIGPNRLLFNYSMTTSDFWVHKMSRMTVSSDASFIVQRMLGFKSFYVLVTLWHLELLSVKITTFIYSLEDYTSSSIHITKTELTCLRWMTFWWLPYRKRIWKKEQMLKSHFITIFEMEGVDRGGTVVSEFASHYWGLGLNLGSYPMNQWNSILM